MSARAIDALPGVDASLQAALAGENACVYAYGLIGAHLDGADQRTAGSLLDGHAVVRDRVRRMLSDLGAVPAPAAPAYQPPFEVTSPAPARRLAALVEDRLALVWADVVASARAAGNAEITEYAAKTVAACSVRSSQWSGRTSAFPGLLAAK